jgi:predicted aspartyl protease
MPGNPPRNKLEAYNATHFDPPAPVASVMLRAGDSGATAADVPLLVDTGADVTLLPRTIVERLGVPVLTDSTYELVGFDGSRTFAPSVTLE